MKKRNEKTANHSLEIGERIKCGEVFIRNIDGYTSTCTVECQLCEDRSICKLTEFFEHLEIWHNDWEDELQHEEMQEIADEFATSMDEVVQPFEKVLIVTETKPTLSLTFSESEEISEISEECEKDTNGSFYSQYRDSLDGSTDIAYTVNVADILKGKAEVAPNQFDLHNEDSFCSTESITEYTSLEDLENEPYSPDFFNSEVKEISNTIKKESNLNWSKNYFSEEEVEDEEEEEDANEAEFKDENNDHDLSDHSEDSGVEKSEIGSSSASTPQHLTFEDEGNFEPGKFNIKEQVRRALNEPSPKPKLSTAHLEKLIEIYESYPHLWRRSHPDYNRPQLCRKSWKEITRKFNRTFRENFSMRDIRVRVSTLCQRYLKERRRREMAYEINEPKAGTVISRFKYFDRLKFLDAQQSKPYEEYASRLAQEHEKLLEIYSHFPLLWSTTDKHHESVERREKAYNDMCTALQLIGIHIPSRMIRQRLTTLRKRYRLEKMRHLHCQLQGKTFETNFKQYESMQFLDRYIAPFVCETCGKIFRKLKDYDTHIMQREHEYGERYDVDSNEMTQKSLVSFSNEKYNFQKETESLDFITDFGESVGELENQILLEENSTNSISSNFSNGNYTNYYNPAALKTSVSEKSNTDIDFITNSNNDECISMKATSNNPLNDYNNLLEIPVVLQSLNGIEDLRGYLNEDQFLTLTTAFEPTESNADNHVILKELKNTIKSSNTLTNKDNFVPVNTVFQDPNNIHIPSDNLITLQVLENGLGISSNATSFVPIELILNGAVNDLVTTQISQESENIVAQYHNEENFFPINTILDEAAVASNGIKIPENLSEHQSTKCFSNDSNLIPIAISFEETSTVLENTNGKKAEGYFDPSQFTQNDCVIPYTPSEESQSPDTDYKKQNINTQIGATSRCLKKKTGKDIKPKKSIKISKKKKTTSDPHINSAQQPNEEDTTAAKKLTAKIECGNLQVELDLSSNKKSSDNKTEPSLLGRLPIKQALELIARYRDFPELWHPEHTNYTSRRLRRLAWRALAKDLNKNLNTNFNWLQIQRKIMDYVKYYRHERRRIQNKKCCTQWCFYDHFNFLDEVMSPSSNLEKRVQQRTQTLKIIEIYKAHPQLWNTRHPHYTKRHQRQRTIAQMRARLLEVHNIHLEEPKLKQRLLELRKQYRCTKIARVAAERRNETFEPLSHFEFFELLQFLEEHIPPFSCVECTLEFKCFTDYNLHMKKEHTNYKRIQRPLLTAHTEYKIENICHICGIKFTLRHNLLQHLNRHYVGRTMACSVCGKKFYTKNTLTQHERIHTKEAGVICADCGKTFVNMSKLNQHMKRHRNQRDYKCEHCNKLFYSAFDRDRHARRHFQVKDKFCPVCGRAFVMGSSFYAHMKLHNDKKEYMCTICNKEFAQYAGLYKHRRKYHP